MDGKACWSGDDTFNSAAPLLSQYQGLVQPVRQQLELFQSGCGSIATTLQALKACATHMSGPLRDAIAAKRRDAMALEAQRAHRYANKNGEQAVNWQQQLQLDRAGRGVEVLERAAADLATRSDSIMQLCADGASLSLMTVRLVVDPSGVVKVQSSLDTSAYEAFTSRAAVVARDALAALRVGFEGQRNAAKSCLVGKLTTGDFKVCVLVACRFPALLAWVVT